MDAAQAKQIEEAVKPRGLTVPQYTTLSVLRRHSGLSNAQLARRSLTTPQSMSEVIAALERNGLISPANTSGSATPCARGMRRVIASRARPRSTSN